MVAKLSQEHFISKCITLAHPNLDFSQAVYVKQTVKVELSCKKHLEEKFTMLPGNVFKGQTSCKKCQKEQKQQQNTTTQEQFLAKCKQTANKNLDLSRAVYKNGKTKVEVSCKLHGGSFYMLPSVVYKGCNGCPKCVLEKTLKTAKKQLTQNEFITKCKQTAHEDLDFSISVYQGAKAKVEVLCKKHIELGSFLMFPGNIYAGKNHCKVCFAKHRQQQYTSQSMTQFEFLIRCENTANKNLDVSNAVYVNQKTKVEVSCKLHNKKFKMLPDVIYKGATACPECQKDRYAKQSYNIRLSQQQFLDRCKEVAHPNLDLSKSIYKNSKTKVEVSCKEHSEQIFYMFPDSIYKGAIACIACLNGVRTHEQFMEQCKQFAHKNLDFSNAVYQNATTKVELSCKEHPEFGAFVMIPSHIYNGATGCYFCQDVVKTQQQFLDKCKEAAHPNLDLSKAVYTGSKNMVKLSCKKHPRQVFYMIPDVIYRGANLCFYCTGRVTNEKEFLIKCSHSANSNLDLNMVEYKDAHTKVKLSCKLHPDKVFYMNPNDVYQGSTGCKKCGAGSSKKEQALLEFIESIYFGEIITNDRSVLDGKELDIYLPEKKLAIEFNGVYWHSDAQKELNYHYDKFKFCKDKNIMLIQIWEDTWDNKTEIVKSMLTHKLGVSKVPKVYARNTEIVEIHKLEATTFLNTYHIQGDCSMAYALGLLEKQTNKLVAVMTFTRTAKTNELLLSRFATSKPVVGGFSKLVSFAKDQCLKGFYKAKNNTEVTSFISFSDNEVSDGATYAKNGWLKDSDVPVSYTYWGKGFFEREHKFRYRLKRFRNDPNLEYVEGFTERQLAKLNELTRCYDSGKVKWRLMVGAKQ